jgi:uncharacterized spore protein YtfJ
MNATDLLQRMGETIGSTATVKAVFGEPIHASGKTVVPVAKVAYGFGGGFGAGRDRAHPERQGEGSGGGGGVLAVPAGALEITDEDTRFVGFNDLKLLTAAFVAGILLGSLIVMRPRRNAQG